MRKIWCGNGEIVVYFRRVHAWFPAFCCQGGEIVVRLRRFLCVFQAFARFIRGVNAVRRWRNYGAETVKLWCVSGVSNPDFPNFTKHSTVLTSILQQINTLYQHFPSAKTAKPALEQAKTMLKIALPTFKNDENHTQNSKIHTQNSVCDVRCGECGGGFLHFGCQGGEMVVRLRHVLSWLRRF